MWRHENKIFHLSFEERNCQLVLLQEFDFEVKLFMSVIRSIHSFGLCGLFIAKKGRTEK